MTILTSASTLDHVNRIAFIEFQYPEGVFGIEDDSSKVDSLFNDVMATLQKVEGTKIQFDVKRRIVRFNHNEKEVIAIAEVARIRNRLPKRFTLLEDPLYISGVWKSEAMMITNLGVKNFFAWQEECFRRAEDFFAAREFKKVNPPQSERGELIAERLLRDYQGFCIGEYSHSDIEPKRYLIEHLDELKKSGVKTLYLEHLFYDSMQKLFNSLHKSTEKTLAPYIVTYLEMMDEGYMINERCYGYLALVQAALKAGIRIVGIDTTGSYLCGADRGKGVEDLKTRCIGMNFVAGQIMQHEQEKKDAGKYVALIGITHTLSQYGVPGVAEIMHIPAVSVVNSGKDLTFTLQKEVQEVRRKRPLPEPA